MDQKSDVIGVIGASFAEGWNPTELAGLSFVNKGIKGERSFEMLKRFERDIVSLSPRIAIIWGFINDLFASAKHEVHTSIERVKESIQGMITLAQDNKIIPIVATELTIRGPDTWQEKVCQIAGRILGRQSYSDLVNKQVLAVNDWLKNYAKGKGLLVLDFQPLVSDQRRIRKKEFATEDGIHISQKGYERLTLYAEKTLTNYLREMR